MVLAAAVACSSDAATVADSGAVDAAPEADACTPYARQQCQGSALYWLDSCGQQLEIAEECSSVLQCSELSSACCQAPGTGVLARRNIPGEIEWTFDQRAEDLSWTFTVESSAENYGMMLVSNPTVGADSFWIAAQTALSSGTPGLLITRFAYRDGEDDIELRGQGSYSEGSAESGSVGLRQPYDFSPGRYRIDATRGDPDTVDISDWLDITITDLDEGDTLDVGSISALRSAGQPVTFSLSFTNSIYLYAYGVDPDDPAEPPQRNGGDATYEQIPNWTSVSWYQLGGADPTSITSRYIADDNEVEFQNLEIQPRERGVFVGVGKDIGRCTPAGDMLVVSD